MTGALKIMHLRMTSLVFSCTADFRITEPVESSAELLAPRGTIIESGLPGGVPRVVLRLRIRHWISHADRP